MALPLSAEQHPLIVEHIPFAKKLAKDFYRRRSWVGLERQEFEGAAFLGLCDAARRFDSTRGMYFRTFAYFRIKGAMLDLVRYCGLISRANYKHLCSASEYRKENEEQGYGEIPFAFAKSAEELLKLLEVIDDFGFRGHLNEDRTALELSYVNQLTPEEMAMKGEVKAALDKLLAQLTPDQRKIIEMRYVDELSFPEIASSLGGLSRSCVSRRQSRAMDELKSLAALKQSTLAA